LPDPRRIYRRITQSNVPTRVIAHLTVVSLVVFAAAAGFSQTQGTQSGEHFTGSAPFVTSVRGAAVEGQTAETTYFDTRAATGDEGLPLDRGVPAVVPTQPTPLPTPVPIDPNATPLAAPTTATTSVGGTTSTPTGVTTRVAAPAPAALVWPVQGGSISQYFHAGHLALDIAAPYGNTVVAAQAGTVTSAGWRNNGGGNVISIDHGNGMITVYNHLGSIWVSPGQYVSAGQGIGAVGCTGLCTGPHVHFEVIVNGVIDNPLRYL
jgi:murein DD-endopeptidase MepM/ murein hydrolase activator NlpD